MRNSLLPIFCVLLLTAIIVPLSLRGPERGSGGPEVHPMLFQAPVKRMHQVDSMPLKATNAIVVAAPANAPAPLAVDLRRFVVVSGEDRSPLTAAVMWALAERITAEGGVVILDPLRSPDADTEHVLPIGAHYVMRIATLDGAAPSAAGGACHAVIACRTRALRVPADHPAARLQCAGLDHFSDLRLTHDSTGVTGGWPNWYAGFGRSIADALLARLQGELVGAPELSVTDWGSRVPEPPQVDVLRWSGAFQHELVRGWIGRIDGVTTSARDGSPQPSLARLEDKLKRGGWVRDDLASTPQQALWSRERNGPAASLTIRPDVGGADVVMWQEWPHAAEVFAQWLDSAANGDALARERLRRHADCEGIPADQRAKAHALLAAAPTAPAATKP